MHRLIVATLVLTLGMALPPEAVGLRGLGAVDRAEMYAIALEEGGRPIQILREICRPPRQQAVCHPTRPRLRRAIEALVDRPITWVRERQPGQGAFWVLGPIDVEGDRASYRYHWREPGSHGCTGGGSRRFLWMAGTWVESGGSASVSCPAT